MASGTDRPSDATGVAPKPLRIACVILGAEAVALVGIGLFLLYDTVFGSPGNAGRALLTAVMAFAAAAALLAGARGLLKLNPSARTPMVVLELLSLPVGYSMIQAKQTVYTVIGGPILIAALAVLYLLFTPPVRLALDRQMDRDI